MSAAQDGLEGYPSLSRVFLRRPVTALVAATVVSLVGAFSLSRMAVSEYPHITPVTITVSATYSGASVEAMNASSTSMPSVTVGLFEPW